MESLISVILGALLGAFLSHVSSYLNERRIYKRQLKDKLREKVLNPLIDEIEDNRLRLEGSFRVEEKETVKYILPVDDLWREVKKSGLLMELHETTRMELKRFYIKVREVKELIRWIHDKEDKGETVNKDVLEEIDGKRRELLKRAEKLIALLEKEAEELGIRLTRKRKDGD